MIRTLRIRHRMVVPVLAAITLIFAGFGLIDRPAPAIMSELPEVLRNVRPDSYEMLFAKDDLWGELEISTYAFRKADGAYLLLAPRKPLLFPDLLVYWVPGALSAPPLSLPDSATLLGPLRTRAAPDSQPPEKRRRKDDYSFIVTATVESSVWRLRRKYRLNEPWAKFSGASHER